MGDPEHTASKEEEQGANDDRIPAMQSIMDNPFLILFLGVAIPTVLYTLWGVMEIAAIPLAK